MEPTDKFHYVKGHGGFQIAVPHVALNNPWVGGLKQMGCIAMSQGMHGNPVFFDAGIVSCPTKRRPGRLQWTSGFQAAAQTDPCREAAYLNIGFHRKT